MAAPAKAARPAPAAGQARAPTTFFTDDFETDTAGKQPAGFDNLMAYIFNNTSNPAGDGSAAVADGTHAHGGKMAAHFHGAANPAFLQLKLPSGTNHLFARVWVYSSVQMGNGPIRATTTRPCWASPAIRRAWATRSVSG